MVYGLFGKSEKQNEKKELNNGKTFGKRDYALL